MENAIEQNLLGCIEDAVKPIGSLVSVETMTPDASMRNYYRALIKSGEGELNVVIMHFLSLDNPEVGGGESIPSDQANVDLARFFKNHGVAVPRLLVDARNLQMLVIEDLGDLTLGNLLSNDSPLPDNKALSYYKKAIDQLLAIQEIPDDNSFVFKRCFSREQYLSEMSEFLDYSYLPTGGDRAMLSPLFEQLAVELDELPRVLVHRDYHSWNLMVDPRGEIRVIDFQDALMATRCYDIVALLNDRATDKLLGENNYQTLLRYYYEKIDYQDDFFSEYDRVLLQRDLKVVGRFSKLSKERGLHQYEKWIPGTLERIGTTLVRLAPQAGHFNAIFDALAPLYPDVRSGSSKNVSFLDERT